MDFFFQNHIVEDGHVDVSQFLMGTRSSGPVRAVEFLPEDELSDDGCQIPGEKKRRLGPEQVRALEKSFESGNKLEPERKLQLARALGLQPRQVAIWFQNRRARWKTKRLEKDYDALKRRFESIKNDNNALKAHNKKLHSQLLELKDGGLAGLEPPEYMNNEGSNRRSIESDEDNKNDVVLTPSINRGADSLIQGQKIDYTNEPLCNIFSGTDENYNYQDFFGLGMDNIINFQ